VKADLAEVLLGFLDAHRQEMLDFACRLIATPSPNPPGDERAVTEVILEEMEALGLEGAEVWARTPERPNLIYRLAGKRGAPCLILNGHTDTKPVGEQDRALWRTDPLRPTFVDGYIYGLGSADMKGAVAAMVYATAALHSLPEALAGDLLLVLVANEEGPGEYGANWLVKAHPLQADFCLVGEPCGIHRDFDHLPICARSTVLFKAKVYGTQMHSSVSDRFHAVNASVKMAWVLWRMAKDLRLNFPPHPLYPQGPTVNLGDFVRGGVTYGVCPGYAEFGSDVRIHPGMTRAGVKRDLEAFIAQLRAEDPELQVELEFLGEDRGEGWEVLQGDEPFVHILKGAAEQVLGRPVPLGGYPAFTDAYWFHTHAGIPSIPAFGPGLLPLAHGPNEHVSAKAIVEASKIYALAAAEYLTGSDETEKGGSRAAST
jgi:acetylornithine deacetylase/succinyl-diaminopimelate desuccinylase-like protein